MKKELYKIILNAIIILCGLMSVTSIELLVLALFNATEIIYEVLTVAAVICVLLTFKLIGDIIFVYVYRDYYNRKWQV